MSVQTAAAAAEPPPAAAEPPAFKLLHRNIILQDRRRQEPINPAALVRGDVAQLSDGRIMARWSGGSFPWSEDHDVSRPLTQPGSTAEERIDAELSRAGDTGYGHLELTESDIVAEVRKFRATFPELAQAIGVDEPDPPSSSWLFAPGKIRIPMTRSGEPPPDWRSYLERHLAGDWGLDGAFLGDPLSLDQVWTIDHQLPAVQNRMAIDRRTGVVRSRHELPPEQQAQARGRDKVWKLLKRTIGLAIVTSLDSHRTVVSYEPIDPPPVWNR